MKWFSKNGQVVFGIFSRNRGGEVVFWCSGVVVWIRIRENFRIWCSGFRFGVVVLSECEVEVRTLKNLQISSKIRF